MKTFFFLTFVSTFLFFLTLPTAKLDRGIDPISIPKQKVITDYQPPVAKRAVFTYPEEEIRCLQENIFFEARNQSDKAKIAVAWVTFNRVHHRNYKNTICGVVYSAVYQSDGLPVKHRCAFSWYCDRLPDRPKNNKIELEAWEEAGEIAEHMIKHCLVFRDNMCPEDPTHGAMFYFNPRLANPVWSMSKVKTASIEDHDFYRYAD